MDFVPFKRNGIFLRERHYAMREERAFKMQVELGFGKFAEKCLDFERGGHIESLAGGRDVTEGQSKRDKERPQRRHYANAVVGADLRFSRP